MTPSLSEQIGSHEAAKVLARKSIDETLHELQTGAYKFSNEYAVHDLMRSIQIWIKGQEAPSSRFTAIVAIGEFESWASKRGFNLTKSHDGTYVYNPAYYAFLGWTEAKKERATEEVIISRTEVIETTEILGLSLNDI